MPTQIYNNIAFIHIPKTGGTSVSQLFPNSELFINKYLHVIKSEDHFLLLHAPAQLLKKYEPNLQFTFAFVRNPYTRFISMFCMGKTLAVHNYKISVEGITQFCKDFKKSNFNEQVIFKSMTYFLYDKSICIVDQILYYENFDDEIKKVFKLLKFVEPLEIPHTNDNFYIDRNDYKEWYAKCPMLYSFVNEIYKEDFKHFNYKMIK